ncbi:MAG: hypothetical protein Fur0037_19210 [Planctomycetota bacterium]
MNAVARARRFLGEGVWKQDLRSLSRVQRALLSCLRVALHVAQSSAQNLASLQAAGLTLLTLLAVVPTLALVTSLAKVLGYGDRLDEQLRSWQDRFPADLAPAFDRVRELIGSVNFGALGLAGSAIVLWSGLTLFTRVEQAMNRVWRTRHRRPWYRRISDFVALIVLVPPLGILALVASSLLGGVTLIAWMRESPWFAWLYEAGLGFVPHVLAWIAFTALYEIMPSARVKWRSAAVGGVFAGSTLVLMHGLYLRLNVGVASANAVYLTFAALPIFLVYVQLLWTVVLAGAEIAYATQNIDSLRGGEAAPEAPRAVSLRVAWHLVDAACRGFLEGRLGAPASGVATSLDVPMEWVDAAADRLVQGAVLVQVKGDPERLMPALPPERIDMGLVARVMDGAAAQDLDLVRLPAEQDAIIDEAEARAGEILARMRFAPLGPAGGSGR